MAKWVVNALVFPLLAVMFIIGLPGLILFSPLILVRWWRRRRGQNEDLEDADIFHQPQVPMPAPLARASAWFKTEEGQALKTLAGLAVVLIGSLVAVFGMGVDPIGALIVAVAMSLAMLGVIKSRGGGPGA